VLFNTFAYARFFAIVFVVAWVLANRRWAPLLPWFAVAGTALFAYPTALSGSVALVTFALTLALCQEPAPTQGRALAAVAVNYAALSWLTFRFAGSEPVTLSLRALDVPVPASTPVVAAVAAGALWVVHRMVRAERVRLVFILAASYVFYAHWDYRFLALIFGS
jgi:hypothetical protein